MNNERKILYISAGINFVVGIIVGTILFYGQVRVDPSLGENVYAYDKSATIADFMRLSWLNLVWIFSVLIAHSIFPARMVHPVVIVRGCVNSFSVFYILTCFGIKEAIASVIPQCLSVLPLLGIFSVEAALKHRENIKSGVQNFSVKRYEVAAIFIFSILAAGVEVLTFRLFCSYLF